MGNSFAQDNQNVYNIAKDKVKCKKNLWVAGGRGIAHAYKTGNCRNGPDVNCNDGMVSDLGRSGPLHSEPDTAIMKRRVGKSEKGE